jgi:hypothetical protein
MLEIKIINFKNKKAMKKQEIYRQLLQEKVQRALRVDKKKMIQECEKLGLSFHTLYDFANYQRSHAKTKTVEVLYFASKIVLGS